MSALCGPCSEARARWLDYRLPPPPIRLVAIGRQDVRHVLESQKARFSEWRDTIRWHQAHIAELCAKGVHAGPSGEPSPSPSSSASGPPSSVPGSSCTEPPAAPSSGCHPSEE